MLALEDLLDLVIFLVLMNGFSFDFRFTSARQKRKDFVGFQVWFRARTVVICCATVEKPLLNEIFRLDRLPLDT